MILTEITAVLGGIASIVAAYYGGGKVKEKQIYSGNGKTKDSGNGIDRRIVGEKEYKANNEKIMVITGNLAKACEDNRESIKENAKAMEALAKENNDSHGKIYNKIEELTKEFYKRQ